MARILLGVAIGAVSAGLILALSNSPTDQAASADASAANMDVRAEDSDIGNRSIRTGEPAANGARLDEVGATPVVQPPPTVDDTAVSAPLSEAEQEARLRMALQQTRSAADRAGYELADFLIERMLADNAIVTPTELPPEFDWVAERRYMNMFHEQFQREPIDSVWAASMEAELTQFVYDQPEMIERYGPPVIRCHSNRCETLFVAPTVEGRNAQADVRGLYDESQVLMPDTFDCEDYVCFATANREGGITTIFWGMNRRRDTDQPQSIAASATERRDRLD